MWMNGLFLALVVSFLCVAFESSYSTAGQETVQDESLENERKRIGSNRADDLSSVKRNFAHLIQRAVRRGPPGGSTREHLATHAHKPHGSEVRQTQADNDDKQRRDSTREVVKTRKWKRKGKRKGHAISPFRANSKETRKRIQQVSRVSDQSDKPKSVNGGDHKTKEGRPETDTDNEDEALSAETKDVSDKPNEDETEKDKGSDKDMDKNPSKSHRLSKETLESLREALLVHPFHTWKFKDRFQSMNDLGIHEAQLYEFIDNKWDKRLEHKLQKVLKGEDIHLAIIGGSNAAGGGIQEDEGDTGGVFHRVISDWWRKTILPIAGSHLKMRQIAMGGTGSDFFQYCYKNYIQDNVDVILLELSVNDLKQLPPNVNLSLPIEQLTRQLLEYPTEPALLYLNLFSGRTYYQGCVNLEDFGQGLLSDVYKITTFSWRDAVCPKIDGNYRAPLKSCGVVCKDGHHINLRGHAHIALMVINLFRNLLLDRISHVNEGLKESFNDKINLPRPVFIASPRKIITSPVCWTTLTPNYRKSAIKNSMEVGVMENYGFDYLHDAKIGAECKSEQLCRGDTYSGWTGKDVGASLTLSFTVPALARKRGLRSRSVVFATRSCLHCGAAEIWLDDDYLNRRYVNTQSNYYQTSLEIIALRVNPGDHTMSVRVARPGQVTAIGVMLGPPDGPY